ncbi:MAG: hypothetical protein IT265_04515 [Saprospiraceae bacterium]|jgi:hypothetical protein|nr:hypothetical protein [Saprospiraceae bacterium]
MLDFSKVDLNSKLKDTSFWTIGSFFVILTGYVSYFTYCVINKIPYSTPNFYLIVGLGLMNIVYWVSIFISTENGNDWDSLKTLTVISYLTYFTYSPITFMSILGIYFFIRADGIRRIIKFRKLQDAELTTELEPPILFFDKWDPKLKKNINHLLFIIIIILTILFGGISATFYLISYYLMYELVYIFHNKKIEPYQIIIGTLLVPCMLTKYFLNETNFSIFGLSKSYINLTYQNGINDKKLLVFQDANYLYVKNSIEDDTTMAISCKNTNSYYIFGEIKYPILQGILNSEKSTKPIKIIYPTIDTCR